MSDNSSNKHRAVNIKTISDKDLKKLVEVKAGDDFKEGDYILLYDNEFVEIYKYNRVLKYKISKENKVYRKK